MNKTSSERAELLERLGDLVDPAFAIANAKVSIEGLRAAVRACEEQAEIYRKLGYTDASKAA